MIKEWNKTSFFIIKFSLEEDENKVSWTRAPVSNSGALFLTHTHCLHFLMICFHLLILELWIIIRKTKLITSALPDPIEHLTKQLRSTDRPSLHHLETSLSWLLYHQSPAFPPTSLFLLSCAQSSYSARPPSIGMSESPVFTSLCILFPQVISCSPITLSIICILNIPQILSPALGSLF